MNAEDVLNNFPSGMLVSPEEEVWYKKAVTVNAEALAQEVDNYLLKEVLK